MSALTHGLSRLSIPHTHWIAKRLGIYEGLHDFLHGFCPCQVELGFDDEYAELEYDMIESEAA